MTILDAIVAQKIAMLPGIRCRAAVRKDRKRPQYSLKAAIRDNPNLAVLAEIKRGSPSLGLFAPGLDIKVMGRHYQNYGASAVSVLADPHFFGSYDDIEAVSPLLTIPVLAKDFVLDSAQIELAYSAGADVILLIAAILSPDRIRSLTEKAFSMGMEVLLELHSAEELALGDIPKGVVLGINNRCLKTFEVSITRGLREIEAVNGYDGYIVAESGIHTKEHGIALRNAGFSGMLIGESLVRKGLNTGLIHEMTNIPRRECHERCED